MPPAERAPEVTQKNTKDGISDDKTVDVSGAVDPSGASDNRQTQELKIATAEATLRSSVTIPSVSDLERNKYLNPSGIELTSARRLALQAMIDDLNGELSRIDADYKAERQKCIDDKFERGELAGADEKAHGAGSITATRATRNGHKTVILTPDETPQLGTLREIRRVALDSAIDRVHGFFVAASQLDNSIIESPKDSSSDHR